jgi:hypothetical protein
METTSVGERRLAKCCEQRLKAIKKLQAERNEWRSAAYGRTYECPNCKNLLVKNSRLRERVASLAVSRDRWQKSFTDHVQRNLDRWQRVIADVQEPPQKTSKAVYVLCIVQSLAIILLAIRVLGR